MFNIVIWIIVLIFASITTFVSFANYRNSHMKLHLVAMILGVIVVILEVLALIMVHKV